MAAAALAVATLVAVLILLPLAAGVLLALPIPRPPPAFAATAAVRPRTADVLFLGAPTLAPWPSLASLICRGTRSPFWHVGVMLDDDGRILHTSGTRGVVDDEDVRTFAGDSPIFVRRCRRGPGGVDLRRLQAVRRQLVGRPSPLVGLGTVPLTAFCVATCLGVPSLAATVQGGEPMTCAELVAVALDLEGPRWRWLRPEDLARRPSARLARPADLRRADFSLAAE